MVCHSCNNEINSVTFQVVEVTEQGYIWEHECEKCGHVHTGYEF